MKVVVYGIGKRFFALFDYRESMDMGIITHEIDIVGFSDSSRELFGKEIRYNGRIFRVKDIQDFSEDEFDKIMVMTSDYFEEIRDGLVERGYQPEQIILADDIFEPYHELIGCGNYSLLDRQWMELYGQIEDRVCFFEAWGYRNVAVYGEGEEAEYMARVLEQAGVSVCRFSDVNALEKHKKQEKQKKQEEQERTSAHKAEDRLQETDIIIVADSSRYMEIEKELCERSPAEVISMRELIYKTLKNSKKGMRACAI